MSIHPVNDRFKVKVDKDGYGYMEGKSGAETGIVVEVPDMLIYLSFHSFAFEESLKHDDLMKTIQKYYSQFLGKRIYWETLQDRGRKIEEDEEEFIYLQMTDLLAFSDDVDEIGKVVTDLSSAGSFNLS